MPSQPTFRVVDALNGPHSGRILRLHLHDGDAPSVRSLQGVRLRATAPDGTERFARVEGFPVFGGRPSDERLRRTGRIDVHVIQEPAVAETATGESDIGLRWLVSAA